jgi:outer membrane protein
VKHFLILQGRVCCQVLHIPLLLATIFWTIAGTAGYGQAAVPVLEVRKATLPEVLKLALDNSAAVKKARLDRQALEQKIRGEARSAMLPQVTSSLSLDAYPLLPTQWMPGEVLGQSSGSYVPVQFGQPWQLTGTVNVEQTLYNLAARRSIPAAKATRELYDLLAQRSEEETIFNTATLFYQTLQTSQLLRAFDANVEKIATLQRIAELQLQNGYLTPIDVKRLRVARTNLETQRQNLVTGINTLRQTLQFLCGVPLEEPFELTEPLVNPLVDSAQWQNFVFQPESNTENRLLLRQFDLNRIQTYSTKASNLPRILAYGTGFLQTQRADANFFNTTGRWFGMAAFGVRAQMPIFDGFRRRYKVGLLELEGQKIDADRQQLRQAKTLEFTQARDQLLNTIQQLRTQEENVSLAREIIEKLTLQYKQGIAPLTDLLNAQTALSEAETNYWQQAFGYKLAFLKLLKTTGRLETLKF